MKYKIPLSQPYLNKTDIKEVKKCLNSSWISSKSPWIEKFEKLFSQKISKTKYSVSLNSGTSALFLALKILNIKQGDEVILPTFTMIATINAITWVGATPILIDSDSKKNWNISIKDIEKNINKKTKAIIVVHTYGYISEIDKIKNLVKKYNLYLIEDAAEAMGSTYKEKNAGSFGDISCFSLYSNKIITTGNGGVLSINNLKIYNLAKKLSFFDFNKKNHFKHNLIGYNLVMSGLQASLGLSQIKKFNKLLNKRKLIFKWYFKFLKNNKNIYFCFPIKNSSPNYWFPAIIFKNKKYKKLVINSLKKNKIEIRDFFRPIHLQPAYKNFFIQKKFPIAEYFFNHGLLLPSYFKLKKDEVKHISEIINRATT